MFRRGFVVLVLAVFALFAATMGQTQQQQQQQPAKATSRGSLDDQQLAASLGIDRQILYEDLLAIQDEVSRLQSEF